jgi:hypothetical protein
MAVIVCLPVVSETFTQIMLSLFGDSLRVTLRLQLVSHVPHIQNIYSYF